MTDPSDRWRRVESLCQAALERDAGDRGAFVAQACGGDAELQREVEALLAHAPAADGFLSAPIGAVAADLMSAGVDLIGRRVGPYEIVARLGAGGMGEVYRARDTALGRDVAIKVLPAAFVADPDRLVRFEREARVLASLNHPHIGAIYGIETIGPSAGAGAATRALILELVEGETLAQRIAKGSRLRAAGASARQAGVEIGEALSIARQMAEALEAAHEQGIVHRDLKPANIKITPGGVVKVLDFGLAKAAGWAGSPGADSSPPPTFTLTGTNDGVILGTAAYMSPEQARGQAVDKRADIWAFGCVLFEMLTGRMAFPGNTVSDHIAAVLEREPEWTALPPASLRLVRLLKWCLEKDPARRLRDIADARRDLEDPALEARPPAAPARRSRQWVAGIATAAAAIFVVVLASRFVRQVPSTPPIMRLTIAAPEPGLQMRDLSLSPDGRQLALVAVATPSAPGAAQSSASRETHRELWVRSLGALAPQRLPGTDGAAFPFWSPDSQAIGFFADGKLKKVSISAGLVQTVCDAPSGRGGTWNRDGVIVFAPAGPGALARVSAEGGTAVPLTALDPSRKESSHRWPQFLPDGRRFLYLVVSELTKESDLFVGSLTSNERQRVLPDDFMASGAIYAWPGYLLFSRDGVLMAVRFDSEHLRVESAVQPIAERVAQGDSIGKWEIAASDTGLIVYQRQAQPPLTELVLFDRAGKRLGVVGGRGRHHDVKVSPDGSRAAITEHDSRTDRDHVWVLDLARGTQSRLTADRSEDTDAVWSPDGEWIAFMSRRDGRADLYSKRPGGVEAERRIGVSSAWEKVPQDWSPDGRSILYTTLEGDPITRAGRGVSDFWVLAVADQTPAPLLTTAFEKADGRFSPDGRWLAYTSAESGRNEVYLQSIHGPAARWQVSVDGGSGPQWRRDGRELFFRSPDGTLMETTVDIGANARVGPPQPLFRTGMDLSDINQFAVMPDGRLLVNTRVDDPSPQPATVIVNWPEELKKR